METTLTSMERLVLREALFELRCFYCESLGQLGPDSELTQIKLEVIDGLMARITLLGVPANNSEVPVCYGHLWQDQGGEG